MDSKRYSSLALPAIVFVVMGTYGYWALQRELASSRPLTVGANESYEAVGLLKLTLPEIEGLEMSVDGGDFVPAAPIRLSQPGEHIVRHHPRRPRQAPL